MKNLTCKFDDKQTIALDNLARKTKQSYGEVVSKALALYNSVIDDIHLGHQIAIVDKGTIVPVIIKEIVGII